MTIALALGQTGLYDALAGRVIPCPLRQADLLGATHRLTAVDNAARCCWAGDARPPFSCPAGIEAVTE